MKKSEVITVDKNFTTYKILGTDFEITQDNEDKTILLIKSEKILCYYDPKTWSITNNRTDYAFVKKLGNVVSLINRELDNNLIIELNEDKTIAIIYFIADCLPYSEIQHISDSRFTLKGEKAQPWEPEQTALQLVEEKEDVTIWHLGGSGYYLAQYKYDKDIYLNGKNNTFCRYSPKTFGVNNDWTANQQLKYAFAMNNEKCVLLRDMDKKDYLSMCLDEDNNIESVHNINDIFNTDVIEITKKGYFLKDRTKVDFKKEE